MGHDLPQQEDVVVLRPAAAEQAAQQVPVHFGVSAATVGARQLSLSLTAFAPGDSTAAHAHDGFETAIYAARGNVELYYGPRLERSAVVEEGSFCFIPAGVPHKAYNLSEQRARPLRHRPERRGRAGARPPHPRSRRRLPRRARPGDEAAVRRRLSPDRDQPARTRARWPAPCSRVKTGFASRPRAAAANVVREAGEPSGMIAPARASR